MRLGARNYITKPWDNEKLLAEIENIVKQQRLTSGQWVSVAPGEQEHSLHFSLENAA